MSTPSFALIAEGETDFEVIRHILAGFFGDPDVVVNQIQPSVDATGAADKPAGGWFEVFRFCGSAKFAGAFQFNDFVVLQIDTDVCEEPGFGVARRHADGRELDVDEMIDAVRARLVAVIGAELHARHRDRIIFAICVDSIECWLLPLYYTDGRRTKRVNCLGTLNAQLSAREGFSIDPERKRVTYYRKIVKPYAKPRILGAHGEANPSMARFLFDLRAACPSRALDG